MKILKSKFINSDSENMSKSFNEVPYKMKDWAIKDFLKALITQKKASKEGKRKMFEMKYRSKKTIQYLKIPHKYIKTSLNILYVFPTFLEKLL